MDHQIFVMEHLHQESECTRTGSYVTIAVADLPGPFQDPTYSEKLLFSLHFWYHWTRFVEEVRVSGDRSRVLQPAATPGTTEVEVLQHVP